MLNHSFFHKKFSVRLALDTTLSECESFLDRYQEYINNF